MAAALEGNRTAQRPREEAGEADDTSRESFARWQPSIGLDSRCGNGTAACVSARFVRFRAKPAVTSRLIVSMPETDKCTWFCAALTATEVADSRGRGLVA